MTVENRFIFFSIGLISTYKDIFPLIYVPVNHLDIFELLGVNIFH